MKNNIFKIIFILLAVEILLHADTSRKWLDMEYKYSDKEKALYYFDTPKQIDGLYKFEIYSKDGILTNSFFSKYPDKIYLEGLKTIYNTNGDIKQKILYKENIREKLYSYYKDKEYIAYFKNNNMISGEMYYIDPFMPDAQKYCKVLEDELICTTFENDLKGVREEIYKDINTYKINRVLYYDNNAKQIAQYSYDKKDGSQTKNKRVFYTYKPMRVYSIIDTSTPLKQAYQELFYPDGTPLAHYKWDNDTPQKVSYYDTSGEEISTLTYKEGKPYDGEEITFYKPFDSKDIFNKVQFKSIYKNGKIQKSFYYSQDGKIQQIRDYSSKSGNYTITTKNEKNEIIGEIIYKNYAPVDGVHFENDGKKITEFKDGAIISQKEYYPISNKLFSSYDGNEVIYYNLEGKNIGSLKVRAKHKRLEEIDGVKFTLKKNMDLIFYENYFKNSHVEKNVEYETDLFDNQIKIVTNYNDDNNLVTTYINDKIRYKKYNKNGQIVEFIAYGDDGKEIARYDATKKDGIYYKSFLKNGYPSEVEIYKNGKLMGKKIYTDKIMYSFNSHELVYDINYNGKSFFYHYGILFAQGIYKDGKPYFGKLPEINDDKCFYTFVDGQKDGDAICYHYTSFNRISMKGNYKNNQKNGLFTYYDIISGDKIKEENYLMGNKL